MTRQLIFAVLIGMIVAASGTVLTVGQPAAHAAETTQTDPAQFARGAKTWANNCARCHNMRDPKELRDDQWRAAMAHMRVRAGLTGQEMRDVLTFLQESN